MSFRRLGLSAVLSSAILTLAPIASGQTLMADLAVTKSGPPTTPAGANVTFDVLVQNLGPDGAVNVVLTDSSTVFPEQPGLTFVSLTAPAGFTCTPPTVGASGNIVCTGAALSAGGSAAFTFTMNVPSATTPGTTFTNTAAVSNDTADPNDENNTSTTSTTTPPPPQADLGVSKTGPNSAAPNSDVTYTIVISNAGPSA
ncbi:MAG: hypothetical protein ABI837_13005, partial [Acidobacteriota bacterium]